jgi:hypothetical protein
MVVGTAKRAVNVAEEMRAADEVVLDAGESRGAEERADEAARGTVGVRTVAEAPSAVPERTGNEEEARESAEVRPRGPRSASLKLSGVGGAPEGMPGA